MDLPTLHSFVDRASKRDDLTGFSLVRLRVHPVFAERRLGADTPIRVPIDAFRKEYDGDPAALVAAVAARVLDDGPHHRYELRATFASAPTEPLGFDTPALDDPRRKLPVITPGSSVQAQADFDAAAELPYSAVEALEASEGESDPRDEGANHDEGEVDDVSTEDLDD